MTNQAKYALKALSIRHRCGKYMARQYAIKHGCMGAYRLACQCEAMSRSEATYRLVCQLESTKGV